MTNKQELRQTAEKAQEHGVFNMDIHSETVLALLDELEVTTDACNGWQGMYAEADERLRAAEKRIAELEAVKCKFSDSKLLSLAKDIVENLVDTGGSDPEYTKQYVDWTCKRIRAAGRINREG